MPPTPKRKASSLVDRANALLRDPNDLELARLRQEAKSLLQSDPRGAHAVLGILGALTNDVADVHKHFRAALAPAPNDSELLFNYSTALNNVGEYEEASRWNKKAYELRRGDKKILDSLIRRTFGTCEISEAVTLLQEWARVSPTQRHEAQTEIQGISDFLNARRVPEQGLRDYVHAAIAILRDKRVHETAVDMEVRGDSEGEWLSVVYNIDRSPQEVVDLSEALADRVAASDLPPSVTRNINVLYLAVPAHERDAQGSA